MGMGNWSNSGHTVDFQYLKEVCKEEIQNIENQMEFDNWGMIAMDLSTGSLEKPFDVLVESLCKKFKEATGLELYLQHYDRDSGDRYDEVDDVDGCLFCLGGVMEMTPAAKLIKEHIRENSWVVFG